jgi:hypothetical protein
MSVLPFFVSDLDRPFCHPVVMVNLSSTPSALSDDHGQFCWLRSRDRQLSMAPSPGCRPQPLTESNGAKATAIRPLRVSRPRLVLLSSRPPVPTRNLATGAVSQWIRS